MGKSRRIVRRAGAMLGEKEIESSDERYKNVFSYGTPASNKDIVERKEA